MKTKRVVVCLLLCTSIFPALRCTKSPTAGNGSQTPNASVLAMLYNQDGSPAVGVRVYIRPRNTLADTSLALRKLTADTASTVTDANGRYAFDTTLDTGIYVIEAANGNDAVRIDSVPVKFNRDDTLGPDTLKPAGAIKGVVGLSEDGDPRKVFVLAFGVDRFARVNADGSFRFERLAEGKYDLRFISSLDNYGVLDTAAVAVKSADTTNLDTVRLPFSGIPTPRNVTVSYDPLKQIVTLSWSKGDTALVKSYNVYRRSVDSNTVPVQINISPVPDTMYKDTTGMQGKTYEYEVVAVGKTNNTGMYSQVVSVFLVPIFTVTNSIINGNGNADGQFGWNVRATSDTYGYIYIIDNVNGWLQKLDSLGTFVFKVDTFHQPSGITNADEQFIYVSDYDNQQIVKIDLQGNIDTQYQSKGRPGAVLFQSDSLFVASDSGIEIYRHDSLAVIWRFGFDLSYSHMDLAEAPDGNLYVVDSKNIYRIDTNSGSFSVVFTIQDEQHNQDARIAFLTNDTLLLLTTNAVAPLNSTIYVIDKRIGVVAKWGTTEAIDDILVRTREKITAFSSEGKIFKLRLNL